MKKIIIYGGTSLLSIEFIKKFENEVDEFIVINRNKTKFEEKTQLFDKNLKNKIKSYQIDILDLEKNLIFSRGLEDNSYEGIFFVMGETGNPDIEIKDPDECYVNYKTNLIHPVLIINSLVPKLKTNSYICVFTSVAGIRGRALRLFYCSSKAGLISYLSGLRQRLYQKNINVINVVAGYMSTEKFKYKANKLLISNPSKVIDRIYTGIKNKREIVYSSFIWLLISNIIKIIPEKIFKKLKF